MPKLKPATQRARREHILDAAEACFARAGFHRTTMQDICKEALVSPGAVYIYFASKEDLIAGIAERNRNEFAEHFSNLATAPDLMKALSMLGEHYLVTEPAQKRTMCIEIALESLRDPKVGEIYRSVDRFVAESFEKLFTDLHAQGRIAPELDIPTVAKVFSVLGDGMFLRSVVEPGADQKTLVAAVTAVLEKLLNPIPAAAGAPDDKTLEPRR